MKRLYILFLILLASTISIKVEGLRTEKIINGQMATATRFRYAVAIVYNISEHDKEVPCAGALLNSLYIATVAHCFIDKKLGTFISKQFFILSSIIDLVTPRYSTRRIEVDLVITHKDYVPTETYTWKAIGNIAIVRLSESLGHIGDNHPDFKHLSIPGRQFKYLTKQFYITGFGWNEFLPATEKGVARRGKSDGKLRYATARVISDEDCQALFHNELAPGNMCVRIVQKSENEPMGICHGDSGGPLVYLSHLKGLAISGTPECDERQMPSIYINTTYYRDFINDAKNGTITPEMKAFKLKEIPPDQYMFLRYQPSVPPVV